MELLLKAQSIDWKEQVAGPHLARGDPLEALESVYRELRGLQDKFIPLAKRRSRTRPKWATQATREAVKEKMRLWKQTETERQGDTTARLKACRKAKRDFENEIARSKDK